MKKRILSYMERVNKILNENNADTDWNALLSEHLVQVGFFQHERLIHLIVTVTFALLAVISIGILYVRPNLFIIGLLVLELVLLVPYISHYYLLENNVQKMYVQYDRIRKKIMTGNRRP